jgi:hypothetical protein
MPRSTLAALILLSGTLGACAGTSSDPTSPTGMIAFAKPGGGGDTPVTATISDIGQIRSDGLGTYTNSSTLTSVIQSIGAWVLDSYNPGGATRKAYLDFSLPIGSSLTTPASALYKVRMISKCNINVPSTSMLTLAPGATMTCPLHIRFDYAGGAYALQMNPGTSADPDGSYPETSYASITCEVPSSGTGACTQWRIEPSVVSGNVAALLKYTTSKGKTVATRQGDFTVSFLIRVTKP